MNLNLVILLIFGSILCTTDQSTVETPLENDDLSASTAAPLIVRSVDKEPGLPKETQMAQCTITSGDIKASAQATFSKKLEGFCSTKDMIDLRNTLAALESRLHEELYDLRLMVRELLPNNYHQRQYNQNYQQNYNNPHEGYNSYQRYDDRSYQKQYHNQAPAPPRQSYQNNNNNIQQTYQETSTKRLIVPIKSSSSTSKPVATTFESIFTTPFTKLPEVVNVMKNKLKSLDTSKPKLIKKISIEPTTQPTTTTSANPPATVPPKSEYTYYWKLENFPKVFNHAKKNEVVSHVFNVKGLFLRIRATLHHHENQNLILDIEHLANIENLDKMEIEISDGFVFKEIAEEKLFQYSFAIMDQTNPNHDLISPIYWNIDSDNFLVPNSVHLLANYVKNDSLLIKLIITF